MPLSPAHLHQHQTHQFLPDGVKVLANGGQWDGGELGQSDVVEADDRHVIGDASTGLVEGAHQAEGGLVIATEDGGHVLWPKVILVNNDYQTIPMLISNLTAGYVTDYGMLMLAVLIASLPTMVLFLLLQRAFTEGITGAVK